MEGRRRSKNSWTGTGRARESLQDRGGKIIQACCLLRTWNGAQHHAVPLLQVWQQICETTSTACAFRLSLLKVFIKDDNIILLLVTSFFVDTRPQKGMRIPECCLIQQQYLGESSVQAGLPVLPPSGGAS